MTVIVMDSWIVTAAGNVFATSSHGDPQPFEDIGRASGYFDSLDIDHIAQPDIRSRIAERLREIADQLAVAPQYVKSSWICPTCRHRARNHLRVPGGRKMCDGRVVVLSDPPATPTT